MVTNIMRWLNDRKEVKLAKLMGTTDETIEQAKKLNFPLVMLDRYLYALGFSFPFTLSRCEKWEEMLKAEGISRYDNQYHPAKSDEKYVATYQVVRSYRGKDYNAMGDYAGGDSGKHGDLVLVRIDEIIAESKW